MAIQRTITITVDGCNVNVQLTINEHELAKRLGAKAVRSAGRKSKLAHGYIIACVSAHDVAAVKAARKAEHEAQRARRMAARCADCSELLPGPYGTPGVSMARTRPNVLLCSNCGTAEALRDAGIQS